MSHFIIHNAIIIKNSIIEGIFIFDNAIFEEYVNFSDTHFTEFVNFEGSQFDTSVDFSRSNFDKEVFFREAHFDDATIFDDTQFDTIADFSGSKFREFIGFQGCKFNGFANFGLSVFSYIASFKGVRFGVEANFWRSKFGTYVDFSEAFFARAAEFRESQLRGELTFRNANFDSPSTQEIACRKAKNAYEKNGNKEEADYHFYREMEAKRIQKGIRGNSKPGLGYLLLKTETWSFWKFFYYDVIEWFFVQKIFGYGVHPRRVIASWFSIVILFTIVYWATDGMKGGLFGTLNYIEGSFATAIAPGYIAVIINSTKYTLTYHAIAISETIIGTFLWAGFIATFAKRYMK